MAKTPIFTGSCTAIVTPYLENGVDYEKYQELLDFQYKGGTSAILVCGTTGENPTHTEEEHDRLVELTVEMCAGKMKTIVGVGGYNTEHVLEQAKHAEMCGADGILMVTPYYNKSTQKGLIEHFTYVADRVKVPDDTLQRARTHRHRHQARHIQGPLPAPEHKRRQGGQRQHRRVRPGPAPCAGTTWCSGPATTPTPFP